MDKRNKRGRRRGRGEARGAPVGGPIDLFGGGEGSPLRQDKRTAQLCSQVERALSLALGNMEDERLLALFVMEVLPAPDATRLTVRVCAPREADLDAHRDALAQAMPLLRSEVAASIHRKRVPQLAFEVIPREALDDAY